MSASKNDWFKDWFNTPYYHLLYKHRDHQEAVRFIHNILNHLSLPKESRILDLACGKGRHAIEIAKKGYEVIGLDLSEESILSAQEHEHDKLNFYTHDMRNTFRVNYFDAIFNLFTSFGYFDKDADNVKCIQAISTGVKSNGYVVIDFLNATKVLKNLIPKEIIQREEIDFHITRSFKNGRIIKDIQFNDAKNSYHFQEKVEAIRLDTFQRYFETAHLKIVDLFGNYDLEKFDENNSDRLIMVLQKQ